MRAVKDASLETLQALPGCLARWPRPFTKFMVG